MGRHNKPRADEEAEIFVLDTPLMEEYLNRGMYDARSRWELYQTKLLMHFQMNEDVLVDCIFSLHSPDEFNECIECSKISEDDSSWPCRTASIVGKLVFGIDMPETSIVYVNRDNF